MDKPPEVCIAQVGYCAGEEVPTNPSRTAHTPAWMRVCTGTSGGGQPPRWLCHFRWGLGLEGSRRTHADTHPTASAWVGVNLQRFSPSDSTSFSLFLYFLVCLDGPGLFF
jgi:hypothetical protein